MAMHQTRIKIFMVIGIIVLTIFIYASYYSNSAAISLTNHVHSTSSLVSTMNSNSYSINSNNNNNLNNIEHMAIVDNKSHNINSLFNRTKQNNTNHHPNNIQLVINNAENILKNLTSSTSTTTTTSALKNSSLANNDISKTNEKNQLSNDPKLPSAAAVRIPIAINNNKTTKLDPSKGVTTKELYESGHLDVNPNLCPEEGKQLRLFIIVTSAPKHADARLAIRQTWGHYSHRSDISMAFILGRTEDQKTEQTLDKENNMYGDLIRGHFVDSYNNLTLKTISSLEWIDKECPLASFVLKTDDDMFINVPKLLQFIEKHDNSHRVIYGRLAKKWKPIRNKKSKYYVAPQQFSQTIFPLFTTGPAYLMSSDVIHDLYLKSLEQTYLKLEDVYTTGIVAQMLGIKRIHVNEFLNRRIAFNPCNIRKAISVHMIKSDEQFDLWKKLLDQRTKCK